MNVAGKVAILERGICVETNAEMLVDGEALSVSERITDKQLQEIIRGDGRDIKVPDCDDNRVVYYFEHQSSNYENVSVVRQRRGDYLHYPLLDV